MEYNYERRFTQKDAERLLAEGGGRNVVIPEGYTTLESDVFEGCKSLESVAIPASVKNIDRFAFFACTSLKTVTFSKDSQLEIIGARAFCNCDKLEDINLPYNVKHIGNGAFNGCRELAWSWRDPIIVSRSTKVEAHSSISTPLIKRSSKVPSLADRIQQASQHSGPTGTDKSNPTKEDYQR